MKMSDEDLRFRDQCAMQILQALLSREESKTAVNLMVTNLNNKEHPDWYKEGERRMEEFVTVSYKIADMMRKARIASFK
jgi:hypothetical protein